MSGTWGAYEARIIEDLNEWQHDTVRVVVRRLREWPQAEYLMSDGTWQVVDQGVQLDPDKVGIVLPEAAVGPMLEAFAKHHGDTGHAATEARILREWLTAERGRVDAVLEQRSES